MRITRRATLILLLLLVLAGIFAIWTPYRLNPKASVPAAPEDRKVKAVEAVASSIKRVSQIPKMNAAINKGNAKIDFWGKVVDQNGEALQGVTVVLRLREWVGRLGDAESRHPKYVLSTDANGFFAVTNGRGDSIDVVAIEKPGYELSPSAIKSFNYDPPDAFSPDPSQPQVFKMWKKGAKQALIGASKFFGIIPDGRGYTIDLSQGTKIEGDSAEGDLQVRVIRPPAVGPRDKYAWSYELMVPSGGLLETNDDFMFLAPEAGYQPSYVQKLNPEAADWTPLVRDKRFFIRTRGNTYGRLIIEVDADYAGKAAININCALNPTGSRSLE